LFIIIHGESRGPIVVNKEKAVITKPFEDREFRTALLKDLAEAKQNFFKMHEIFGLAYQSDIGVNPTTIITEEAEEEAPAVATSGSMIALADVTNNTVNLANITGLYFPALASKIYGFSFYLKADSAAATCAIHTGASGPAGPGTYFDALVQQMWYDGTNTLWEPKYLTSLGSKTNYTNWRGSYIHVHGTLRNGLAAGNLQLQFASEVAGTTVTIYAGSRGVWYKLT
jgi:hypothetical protein